MTGLLGLRVDADAAVTLSTDLGFFRDRFIGRSLRDSWVAPPIGVVGGRGSLRDFVSWMIKVPVVSARAKAVLEPLTAGAAEFLPLIDLRGIPYFALNVVATGDFVDVERSSVTWHPERPDDILQMDSYAIATDYVPPFPIIKFRRYPVLPFVSSAFVDICVREELTGAAFIDPRKNQWARLLTAGPVKSLMGKGRR